MRRAIVRLSCRLHDICRYYRNPPPTYNDVVDIIAQGISVQLKQTQPQPKGPTRYVFTCSACLLARFLPLMIDGKKCHGLFPVNITQDVLVSARSEREAYQKAVARTLRLLADACE